MGSPALCPQLRAGSPQDLDQLAQPLTDIRALDLVIGAHELQRLALGHGIGLVARLQDRKNMADLARRSASVSGSARKYAAG